jgi:eukaryotic-like serine/threonine-protein kinase
VAAGAGGGTLVYGSNLRASSFALTWMDRRGQPLGTVGPVANYSGLSLSTDGLFATTGRQGPGLFLYDLARNSEQRFITSADARVSPGVWSEDGNSVVFTAALDGVRGIYRKPANGSGKAELLLPSLTNIQIPADLSATGTLVFTETDPKTQADIWYVATLGGGSHTPEKFLATAAMESQPQLSPDGRWLAYVSDESGRQEVYVRQFPSGLGFAKVSSQGGREPRWKHDGSELYFREGAGVINSTLLAVPMHADSRGGISAGVPVALFRFSALSVGPQTNVWQYAPSPDGQRFLMAVATETAAPAIHVITNWLKATKDAGKQ